MRSSRRARTPKSSKRRSSKRRAARRARVPKAPKARRRSSSRSTSRRSTSRRRARAPRASKSRSTSRRSSRRARTPKGPRRRSSRRSTSRRRQSSRRRVARRRVARKAKKPKIVVGSMRRVWSGTADRTGGGLRKKDLVMNKNGKIVSKKQSAQAKKKYKSSGLGKWTAAVQKAREEMGVTGFMAVKKGTPLYKLAKSYYN